jgi:hypothetical protein
MTKQKKDEKQEVEKLRWAKVSDLTLIPPEMIKDGSNPDVNVNTFYHVASMVIGAENIFAYYGVNGDRIKTAVIATFNPIDGCIYLDNWFGAKLTDPNLLEIIKKDISRFNANGVKVIESTRLALK